MKIVTAISVAFVVLVGAVALTAGGSEDDAAVNSSVRNVALAASSAPEALNKDYCLLLKRLELDDLDSRDLEKVIDILDRRDLLDLYDRLDFDFIDRLDFLDLYWPWDIFYLIDLIDDMDPEDREDFASDKLIATGSVIFSDRDSIILYERDNRSGRFDMDLRTLFDRLHLDLELLDRIDDGDHSAHLDLLDLLDALNLRDQCAAAERG